MKKIVSVAIVAFFAFNVSALSPVKFGVKGGVLFENIDIKDSGKSGLYDLSSDNRVGWQFGVMSRIQIMSFHIQPEILYNMHRYRLAAFAEGQKISGADVKVNTIDVPVLCGLQLLFLRVQAGPTFNLLTETLLKNQKDYPMHVRVKRPTIAYTLGLGVDLWGINVDARYNGNFKRSRQDVQVNSAEGTSYRTRFNNWAVSVGYMF